VPALGIKKWALPAGHDFREDFRLPSVGDPVWIAFQDSKVNLPIWFFGWPIPSMLDDEIKSKYPGNESAGPRLIRWRNMRIYMDQSVVEIRDDEERTVLTIAPDDATGVKIKSEPAVVIECESELLFDAQSTSISCSGNADVISSNNVSIAAGMSMELSSMEETQIKSNKSVSIRAIGDVSLESGATQADSRGIKSGIAETNVYHFLKTTVEAPQNEVKGTVENVLDAPQNTIKGSVRNVLDAPLNFIGSQNAIEPLVLGNQLVIALQQIIAAVLTPHTGNVGAPTVINPAIIVQLTQLSASLQAQILSLRNRTE
jgi:hypothetical protein